MGIFIRPTKSSFRIIEETYVNGGRVVKTVPKESYPTLGFRFDMSLNEAKDRASQLNKQTLINSRKIAATKRQQELKASINEAFIPAKLEAEFRDQLDTEYEDNPDRLETINKHWSTAKKVISEVELDPKDYYVEKAQIFNYYKKKNWSPDYIKRITSILNRWGHFYSRKHNSFFQEIPKLTANQAQRIVDNRDSSDSHFRTAARPLLVRDLVNAKTTFEHSRLLAQWNWLYIGLWFGLRPTEIDNLKNNKYWKVIRDKEHQIDVLEIYQTKLTKLSRDKRWKQIPVYLPEQKEAIKLIESEAFKRPLVKTLTSKLGEGYDTYSPRKGFTDLMLERGFSLDDVSLFLGHESIDTTWKHYKNKRKFKLPA
jgi:integrase